MVKFKKPHLNDICGLLEEYSKSFTRKIIFEGRYSRWVMKIGKYVFNASIFLMFQLIDRKSKFAALHSDINGFKSGLLHSTGQPNSQKGRATKVNDGIISETTFLGTISVD